MNFSDFGIYVPAGKVGQYKCRCPKCSDKRKNKLDKCLSVNIEEGIWNCKHCGWKGTTKVSKPKKEYTKPTTQYKEISKEQQFFATRGISLSSLNKMKVSIGKEWMPKAQSEIPVICFNYFNKDQELVNIKFRGENKDFKLVSGAELIFWGMHLFDSSKTIVITEGEMDALSVCEAGPDMVVLSVPNGAPNGNGELLYVDNCIDYFEGVTKIILALDNDEPGIKLRNELARRFGKQRCYYIEYPEGCKDLNEVLMSYDKNTVIDLLDNAQGFPIDRVINVSFLREVILSLYDQSVDEGISLKLPGFDDLLRFKPGQLTTVTGIPSHGKSVFVEFLTNRLNVFHGWKGAVFSPEHSPLELHFQRQIKQIMGKPFFSGRETRLTKMEVNKAYEYFKDRLHYIQPDEDEISLDQILDSAEQLVQRYGINYIIIDPWNEIDHDFEGMSETQYSEKALRKIKRWKNRTECHVFLIAHPTKMTKDENGVYHVPTLYNISGSAHFYNKTDNGICVYRDFEKGETRVYVQKVKFSHLGAIGDCVFRYNTQNDRFSPVDKFSKIEIADNSNWLAQNKQTEIDVLP